MEQCNCKMKKQTPRSEDLKKSLLCRLNRIQGQVNGMGKMIEDGRYCADILIQLSAVEKALESVGYLILQDHMESCVEEKLRHGDREVIPELLDLVRKLK